MTSWEEIFEQAERGIAILETAQVGCADMETRKARREAAHALLAPYWAKLRKTDYVIPRRFQEADLKIMNRLTELT